MVAVKSWAEDEKKRGEIDDPAWRLVAGNIVERPPRLTIERQGWEAEWDQFRDETNRLKQKVMPLSMSMTDRTLQQQRQHWARLLPFDPPKRLQPADHANDHRSLARALDQSLYLLVKKDRAEHPWQFPQGHVSQTDHLRLTAERELVGLCGPDLAYFFLGNCPIGYVNYTHAPHAGTQEKGTKLFLMHSIYLGGRVTLDKSKLVDHVWVTPSEMSQYLTCPDLLAQVDKLLYTEKLSTRQFNH